MKQTYPDLKYPFLVEPNDEDTYYVRFPDFPTVFTGGTTQEETLRNATEALEVHIATLRTLGRPLPERRPLLVTSLPAALQQELTQRARHSGKQLSEQVEELLGQAVA